MPNFNKDKSGFNMKNPMSKVTGIRGENTDLPGMVGTTNPSKPAESASPFKILGAIAAGALGGKWLAKRRAKKQAEAAAAGGGAGGGSGAHTHGPDGGMQAAGGAPAPAVTPAADPAAEEEAVA
tara:strand:- start:534 stop:905 length:372 start_codon:yes stop_codon:yes gene_type:complete